MNKLKKYIIIGMVIIVSLSLFCLGCGLENPKQEAVTLSENVTNNELTIKMLDIGQGDAILIKTQDQVILVDTGDVETRDQIVSLLKKEKIKKIDKLIISHPHADHLGGAYAVLNNFEVGSVYDNGQPTTTSTYRTYMKIVDKKHIPYQQLLADTTLDFGNGVTFKVFSPTAEEIKAGGDLNSNSIVGKLIFNDFSMLFTGDCEADREKIILDKYKKELKSTILKSPHHGSKTSSNRNYLKAIAPEAVLISVGKNNDYKHPHAVTINKYKDLKMNIYQTDQMGTITVTTDGKSYKIEKEK